MTADIQRNIVSGSNSDNRYMPRWHVNRPLSYQLEGDNELRRGVIKDLNYIGACINIDRLPNIDQAINLTVQLSKTDFVKLNGKVVWMKGSDDQVQVGVNFKYVDSKERDIIFEHAFEINREEIVGNFFKGWENKK